MASSHEVLGECHMSVEVEVKAPALGSAARDAAPRMLRCPVVSLLAVRSSVLVILSEVLLLFLGDLVGFVGGSFALFVL